MPSDKQCGPLPRGVRRLAVMGPPRSGKGGELMALHGIDAAAVVKATLSMMG